MVPADNELDVYDDKERVMLKTLKSLVKWVKKGASTPRERRKKQRMIKRLQTMFLGQARTHAVAPCSHSVTTA